MMKRMISAQYIGLLALVFSIAASSVNAEPINTDRFGLYVVVDDNHSPTPQGWCV